MLFYFLSFSYSCAYSFFLFFFIQSTALGPITIPQVFNFLYSRKIWQLEQSWTTNRFMCQFMCLIFHRKVIFKNVTSYNHYYNIYLKKQYFSLAKKKKLYAIFLSCDRPLVCFTPACFLLIWTMTTAPESKHLNKWRTEWVRALIIITRLHNVYKWGEIYIIKLFIEKHYKSQNSLCAKYIWYSINYFIAYIAALTVGKWDIPDKEYEIIYTNSNSKHPLQDTSLQCTFFF